MMMAITPNSAPPAIIQEMHDEFRTLPHAGEAQAEQDRKQQHLQNLALGKRIDHGVGDDVQQEGDDILVRGVDVGGDGLACPASPG